MRRALWTTLALALLTLPTLAASPAQVPDTENVEWAALALPLPLPAMSSTSPAACTGEDPLFNNAAEAVDAGFTAPLQGGPCTGVACTSHYECQQYCGAYGGRCGFPDCEPNTCYCFF